MTFTADQYAQMAQSYDKAAADHRVTPEKKSEFVKKAEWFHLLAQRERETRRTETDPARGDVGAANRDSDVEPDSSPHRSMAPFLTMLWLTGAVLYLLGTVLFMNAVNLFGDEDDPAAVIAASRPVEPLPKVADAADVKANERDDRQVQPAADRRHAISPDQPAYEAPTLTAPPASVREHELQTPSELIQDVAGGQSGDVLTANQMQRSLRRGPSTDSKKIGTATPGAELQVEADIQTVEPPKQEIAKKRAKPKRGAPPSEVTEQQRKFVDLPDDEEFLPARRHPGLLAKRRMLREGLMSPGFLPPR